MNKKHIWILAIIMVVALTGLIIIQINWIKNAILVNEEHFTLLVNNAIDKANQKIETHETIYEISNEMYSFADSNKFSSNIIDFENKDISVSDNYFTINKRTIYISDDKSTRIDSVLRFFSGDSLITQSHHTYNELVDTKDPLETNDFKDIVSKTMGNKALFVEKIVNKILKYNDNIFERVRKTDFNNILEVELRNSSINLEYEYAVIFDNDSLVLKSKHYDCYTDRDFYKSRLFPNDVLSEPIYLSVYFPKKKNYIIKSLGKLGLSSAILTFIITLTFVLMIFVVFKQKRLSDIKNDFVHNMTHELKTPISTISLASQMLKDDTLPKKPESFSRISSIIDEETRRLSFHVEKVLQVAIFEQGKLTLNLKTINVDETLSDLIKNFEIRVSDKEGTLEMKLNAENASIDVDNLHFSNVITNLLDNAVKYSKETPEIIVSTSIENNKIIIQIEDKGIGISRLDQKRIFEKFYRVSTGDIHNVKGFGLGLTYVKRIIDEHEGIINLHSKINFGTKFDIILPLSETLNTNK